MTEKTATTSAILTSYPASVVHTFLLSVAGSLDTMLHRPVEMSFDAALDLLQKDLLRERAHMSDSEKEIFQDLRERFLSRWNSFETSRE